MDGRNINDLISAYERKSCPYDFKTDKYCDLLFHNNLASGSCDVANRKRWKISYFCLRPRTFSSAGISN